MYYEKPETSRGFLLITTNMKLPFHNVQVCGDILFAARGGNIHSFKLSDGSHVSCWRYPAEKKDAKSGVPKSEDKLVITLSEESTPAPPQDDQGPPAKRVKLDAPTEAAQEAENGVRVGNGDAALDEAEEGAAVKSADRNGNGTSKDQKKSKKPGPRPGPRSPPSERTMVLILTATSDGRHLVAVTQCKSIWVFEHDGQGQLKQLSRRYVAIYIHTVQGNIQLAFLMNHGLIPIVGSCPSALPP